MSNGTQQIPAQQTLDDVINSPFAPAPDQTKPEVQQAATQSLDQIINSPFEAPPKVEQSPTGQSAEPMPGWSKGLEAAKNALQVSTSGLNQSLQGTSIFWGRKSFKDAKETVETHEFLQAQQDLQDYQNTHGFQHFMETLGSMDVAHAYYGGAVEAAIPTLGIDLVKQIPQLGAVGAGMAIPAAIAYAVGAPVAVPATVGGALVMGFLAAGHQMYNLKAANVDDTPARAGAILSGTANFLIGLFGGAKGAVQGIESAAASAMGKDAVKTEATNFAGRIAHSAQMQVASTSMSSMVDNFIKWIGTRTSGGATRYSTADALKDINETTMAAFPNSLMLSAAFEGTGQSIGAVMNTMLPDAAVQALSKAFQRKVKEYEVNRANDLIKAQIEFNENLRGTADEEFKSALNKMNADELQWFMQLPELSDEVRSAIIARYLELTNPGFTGHTETNEGGPGQPIYTEKALKEIGMQPEPQPKEEAEPKPGEKPKPKRKPPKTETTPSMTDKETQSIIDKLIVAARIKKGAAEAQYEAAKKAQAEGRELTEAEKKALDRQTFIEETADKEPEFSKTEKKGWLARYNPFSRTAGFFNGPLRTKLKILVQDAPPEQQRELLKLMDAGAAVDHAAVLNHAYLDLFYGHIEDATGLNRAQVENLGWKAKQTKTVTCLGRDGEPMTLTLSIDEMMKYLMQMKNAKAKVGLQKGNGYTTKDELPEGADSTEAVFERTVLRADPQYGRVMEATEIFYEQMGETLKAAYEKFNPGKTLIPEPKYGGIVIRENMTERAMGDDLTPFMPGDELEKTPGTNLAKGNPAFTKERGATGERIQKDGLFGAARRRCRQQAYYEAMTEPSRLWNAALNDAKLSFAARAKFGEEYWKSLKNHYKDIVQGLPRAQGQFNAAVDALMTSRSFQILGGKILQSVKHLTTLFQFSLYRFNGEFIPADVLLKGIVDAHGDKAIRDTLMNWPEVKERYATDNLSGMTDPDALSPRFQRLKQGKLGMAWFAMGDRPALLRGTYAVYKWVLSRTGDPVQAKAEAVSAFRNILASGAMDQLSDFSRAPIAKIWAQFGQPAAQLRAHEIDAWREAANFRTEANLRAAMRTTIISHIAAGLFVLPEAIIYQFTAEQKDADRKAAQFLEHLMAGNLFPIEDAVFQTVVAGRDPDDIYTSWLASVAQVAHDFTSDEDNGPYEIMTKAIHIIQATAVAPLPVTPIQQIRDLTTYKSEPKEETTNETPTDQPNP